MNNMLVNRNTEIEIKAIADNGYKFNGWNNGETTTPYITTVGNIIDLENPLTASFIEIQRPNPFNSTCPNDEIWYMTDDNYHDIINPKTTEGFGANIISNTRNNEKGIIKFDNNIRFIPNTAFQGTNIKAIYLPNSVEVIGRAAFNTCRQLNYIVLGNSIANINEYAFYAIADWTIINYLGSQTDWYNIAFGNNSNPFGRWPNENNYIQFYIGSNLINLNNLNIPEGVSEIKDNTFKGTTDITVINFPSTLTKIGKNAFMECKNLTSLNIPNNITQIETYAFEECLNLSSISIGNGITCINSNTFGLCGKLENITLSNTITEIKDYAFYACGTQLENISNISLPNNLLSIEHDAFGQCEYFNINIPDCVISIGDNAFDNVPHIEYHGTATGAPWGALSMN